MVFRGMTQEALAEKYEISQQRVSQIIAQVRESIPPEDKDKVRQEHLELARTMRAELAKLVDMGPIPAYSNGRPIVRRTARRRKITPGAWPRWTGLRSGLSGSRNCWAWTRRRR
jgi:transcriptional regulator with XRE-family HTH domain